MKETKIILPLNKNFYLKQAITNEIKRLWDESLFMAEQAKKGMTTAKFDIFWKDAIDTMADIKLQIMNQEA